MSPEQGLAFVERHHRAVMVTHGRDGAVQTSPVTVGRAGDRVAISSRDTAFKVRNLRRDPRTTLTVFTDGFYGDWVQIDGRAEVVGLPEAMDGLVEYYRRISGEHPDWDEYRAAMERDRRVLVLVTPEHVGPDRQG